MCVPLAPALVATALAIEVGSSIAEHKAQGQRAQATRQEAERARILERRSLAVRQIQESIATSQRLRGVDEEASRREGSIRASAAAGGVSGGALNAILADLEGSAGRSSQDIRDSNVATLEQIELEKLGADARAAARIAGAPEPSSLATGLRIGGAITGSLASLKQLNTNKERATVALGEEDV